MQFEYIEISKLNPQAIIKTALNNFVRLYSAFNQLGEMSNEEVVAEINRGDCGVTAIAVHHVLKEKYKIETTVVVCRNHCWLCYEGIDYDTLYPEGYEGSAAAHWEKDINAPRCPITFKEACDEWMPCDVKGAVMVKGFCDKLWVKFPPELQHCFDNADEYERPGELAKYEAQLQSALEKI